MRYRLPMQTRDLSRRAFLSLTAAAPFAASGALKGAPWTMQSRPVGLELYSVRGDLAKDLLGTVAAVGKMGYEVVEFYSPYMQWTPERAKEVRKVLDDSGLKCPSTHNGAQSLTADGLKKAIELNQIIGSKYIIVASASAKTVDDWKKFAAQLTQASEQLAPLGMATGFHNHAVEWRPVDGQRPMDVLAANSPKDVVLQFDVGTCLEAGADPIAWINANPGRIKSVHCKDWAPDRGYNVAFGEGVAPWKAIFAALERTGGVEYYLIEQETGASHSDGELGMVRRCLENWRKMK
jgi:sugar phosphate isomerase/epimerase